MVSRFRMFKMLISNNILCFVDTMKIQHKAHGAKVIDHFVHLCCDLHGTCTHCMTIFTSRMPTVHLLVFRLLRRQF